MLRINSQTCQRCGACCSAMVDGEIVACRHLEVSGGEYRCAIYAIRPQLCRDYSCVRDGKVSSAVADRVFVAMDVAA
mgnify:CR=1 FL=1